jgi:predicted phage terminase large subunit-like protein
MHEDDLTGMLLAQQAAGGDRWEVLELKPNMERGIALWPKKYPMNVLRRIQANTMPKDWSALYLQNPTPEEGDYFKEEWLRPYTQAPERKTLVTYGGSDFAVTSDGGDYTCHVVIGIDAMDRPWLLYLWRAQTSSDVWVESWCDLVKKWKPYGWAFEQGQIKSGVGPFLEKRARERKAWTAIETFPTRGDKAVRAQSIRGRMALMGLQMPIKETWYADLHAELLSFPAGKHDDQVDALGLVGQLLDRMSSGPQLKEEINTLLSKNAYRPRDEEPNDSDSILLL